jgi:hypothetical protein
MAEMEIEATATENPVTFRFGETVIRVEPVWCRRSEEVKLNVSFVGYGDTQAVAQWDGSSIVWVSEPTCPLRSQPAEAG